MKTMYICEKCGATYTNYDEAYACENKHYMLDISDDMLRELEEYVEYGQGKEIPSSFICPTKEISEWDEDAGEFKYRRIFAEYKLVRILKDSETKSIVSKYEERKAKERREWNEYWERREAEKKAKEEAEKAESEAE